MAINKSKVAVGFIVVGVLTVFFGTLLTFVGPLIIDDQVVKVGCHAHLLCSILTLKNLEHLFAAQVSICAVKTEIFCWFVFILTH